MVTDLLIAFVGLAMMVFASSRVGRPGTEYKPYIGLYSLGLFLIIVEFVICLITLI